MTTFVDLGATPLANAFPRSADEAARERSFPLHARVCDRCLLVQVEEVVPPEEIFTDYAYFSSFSSSWVEHARRFAEAAIERFGLTRDSLVVEIASNDGYLLRAFRDRDIGVVGIEPAANVAARAEEVGVPTIVRFFGRDLAEELVAAGRQADLLIANNVLAHVPDLDGFVAGMARMLAPGGSIAVEFPHLLNLIIEVQFDTIYHEHFSYFSLVALEPILARHGLRLFDVEQLPTHGGSLRIHACRTDDARADATGVAHVRALEHAAGLDQLSTYTGFGERVSLCLASLRAFLDAAHAAGESIAAYGAAAKGNTLLNTAGVTADEIEYVVDASPHKQGRLTPGSHLPIRDPDHLRETRPDWLLVLPWNLLDEIVDQTGFIREWGGRHVTAVPEIRAHG